MLSFKKTKSVCKARPTPKIDLKHDDYDLISEKSSILDAQTGRVKNHKMKYNLNDLFENTPVFDSPAINFKGEGDQNNWKFIATDVLSDKGKLTKALLLHRKNQ